MKHIKLFEQFVNEGKEASKIVNFLQNMAQKGWKKFDISSGSDLYEDPTKQEQYIKFVKDEIKKANLSNDILKFGEDIHDELESDNYHHLNMLLALAGYYKPDVKSRYMSYLKNRPKDAFALDLFEQSLNEARISAYRALEEIVKGNTSRAEGVKMSKALAQHYMDWLKTSPYGKKYGMSLPLNIVLKASFLFGIERGLDSKLKGELESLKSSINESLSVEEQLELAESIVNEATGIDISKLTDHLLLQMIAIMNTSNVKSNDDLKFMQELVKEKMKRKLKSI